jgi:hypothetical protein
MKYDNFLARTFIRVSDDNTLSKDKEVTAGKHKEIKYRAGNIIIINDEFQSPNTHTSFIWRVRD